MRIETRRLIFKQIEEDDVQNLYQIYNDEELIKYFVSGPDKFVDQTKERIEKIKSHWDKYNVGDFILLNKENLEPVGYAGLHYKEDGGNINISYIIDKKLWGNGLGYETCLALIYYGFRILELDKIIAEIDPQNINSIKLIEKCGFKFNRIMEWKGFERLEYLMSNKDIEKIKVESLEDISILED
jgi:ribosomal-protein-alanine N-acetyltransferase